MVDFLSKEKRSALMSRVRSRGTSSERYVRKAVWSAGFRYRLNVRRLPGAPDLVFPRYNTVALVQGCFWHGHSCRKGQRRPATNQEFWSRKLDGNIARDTVNQEKLRDLGWTVFVVWECLLNEGTDALLAHLNKVRMAERQPTTGKTPQFDETEAYVSVDVDCVG